MEVTSAPELGSNNITFKIMCLSKKSILYCFSFLKACTWSHRHLHSWC